MVFLAGTGYWFLYCNHQFTQFSTPRAEGVGEFLEKVPNDDIENTSDIGFYQIGKIESLNASVAFGILLNDLIKKGT